jgi:putative protein-disulfide isomerase
VTVRPTVATNELIFVGDPMCLWCYAFIPTLQRVAETFSTFPLRIVIGGLRVRNNAQPWTPAFRNFLKPHVERAAAQSGRAFNPQIFDREGFVLDTEWPDRAIVAMRTTRPRNELQFFDEIACAWFQNNQDTTDGIVVSEMGTQHGIEQATLLQEMRSVNNERATWNDFAEARQLGANGFPTLLVRNNDRTHTITSGYATYDEIAERIVILLLI